MSWLLLLAVVTLACAAQAQDNLLANAGFEQADTATGLPAGWVRTHGPADAIALRADGGHVGEHYLRFVDPAADVGLALESAHVAARPGGRYTLTGWLRTADACQPGLYIQFHDVTGARIAETHARATGPTDGWVQVTVHAAAPEEAVEVSALVYAYIGDVGTFDVDDLALSVVGGSAPGRGGLPEAQPGDKPAAAIGARRELFIDDFLIDGTAGDVARRLHHPTPREVVLEFDRPWEGDTSIYVTVIQEDDRVRLYYRGSGHEGQPAEVACYAESRDGIHFERPELGLYEFGGSKANNIVWAGKGSHNFTPFLDTNPAAPADQRYKALAAGPLVALASPDGVRWRLMRDEPVLTQGAFDSQNLAFWDPLRGRYVTFYRGFRDGVRDVMTATSQDFLTWTEPQWLDYGGIPPEHLYTNAITPYPRAPHLYVGFPKRFVPSRKAVDEHPHLGVSDGVLMSSRDGLRFDRWREAFLRPGPDPRNWTDRNNAISYGLAQLDPGEISLYWVENYRHPTCRLRRGTLRADGFVSLHAGADGGEVLTRPLVFEGDRLLLNFATSAVGFVRIELCDEAGEPLPGYDLASAELLYGDDLERPVRWGGSEDLSPLAGRPVRLRILMRDADLYSFRFAR